MYDHITILQFTAIWSTWNEKRFLLLVGQALGFTDVEINEKDRDDRKNRVDEVEAVNADKVDQRESSPTNDQASGENADSSNSQSNILASLSYVNPNDDRIGWAEDEAMETDQSDTGHYLPNRVGVSD